MTPSGPREATSDRLIEVVDNNFDSILSASSASNSHFNAIYTLIARYQNLTEQQRATTVDTLIKLTRAASVSNASHLKICLFLASGLTVGASSTSPLCKFWEKTGCESLLESVLNLISNGSTPLSFSPADLDQLSSLLVRTSLHVLENPSLAKSKHVRPLLSRCLVSAFQIDQRQSLPASTALLYALCRHEHIPTPLADVLHKACTEAQHFEPFVSEFVRETARLPPERLVQDVSAAKSVSQFLTDFADKRPSVFGANVAVILSLLGVDSYVVRNGVVHVIAALIQENQDPNDPLLDILLQRASRDAHAFTRSKALQCWIFLVNKHAVPNRFFPVLADMAASRLDDRTAAVRKYAAQLLTTLLVENPFGPALRLSHFKSKLESLLAQYPDANDKNSSDNTESNAEDNGKVSQPENGIISEPHCVSDGDDESVGSPHGVDKSVEDGDESNQNDEVPVAAEMSSEREASELREETPEQKEVALKKTFYRFAVDFIRSVEGGLKTIYNMLRSKSITDVAEAVSLVITTIQFQIEAGSGFAVRKMLPLVLARENNVREKVVDAYVRLLAPNGLESIEEKEAGLVVARGLIMLAVEATMGELACLKGLVHALCSTREECRIISPSVITILWDLYEGKIPGASMSHRRGAAIVVSMIVEKQPDTIFQRIEMLHQNVLNEPELARWSCAIAAQLPDVGSSSEGNSLCAKLQTLCISSNDFSTVEQAVHALVAISEDPETLFSSMINGLAERLYNSKEKVAVKDLSRFFIIIGHVAVKELVRIERLVLQFRKQVSENVRPGENNEEEEQASAKADAALELAEKELISPSSILGRYGTLAETVAADTTVPEELRACAVLCLAKLMCVQEKFCKRNLRLLFSILASGGKPSIRVNAVTALGDLAFRFPNLIEPWSTKIYDLLRDEDTKVRKNALMVLTHLILNDMVKVKGQIVWMAMCILDDDERIADMAQVFFFELARKAVNAIYNILPDTISCMSRMENVSSEQFKKVIAFLMGLMDKERHADGMVGKLCHRFHSSTSERENRDLAYCIAQLNMSSKGVVKLSESFKSYSAALIDDDVYSFVMQAITKGSKSGASGALAQVTEELTAKIDAVRQGAAGDDETELSLGTESQTCPSQSSQATETSRVSRSRRATRKSVEYENSAPVPGESCNELDETSDRDGIQNSRKRKSRNNRLPPKQGRRQTKSNTQKYTRSTRSRKRVIHSSDESEQGDLTERTPLRKKGLNKEDSSEDGSE